MNYWIRDIDGRVLGPIGLDVLGDLVQSERLRGISHASRDGRTFETLDKITEVSIVVTASAPKRNDAQEQVAAKTLRAQLLAWKDKPPRDVLGVSASATLAQCRGAFFPLIKRLHPDRLSRESNLELRVAHQDAFRFLSATMRKIESESFSVGRPLRPSAGPESSAPLIPAAPPASSRSPPTYAPEEFVGLERSTDDRMCARIRVDETTWTMFTEHKLVNLQNDSFFVRTANSVALGTALDLVFLFDSVGKEIKARGRVVWENAGDPKQPGYGVRFLVLSEPDRTFIKDFVRRASSVRRI